VLEQTKGLHLQAKFHLNVFIVSASGGQKAQFWVNFDIFGGSCTEVEHGCTTTNLPLSNSVKIVSVLQRLHGEIGRTNSNVQKRDGQTDKQTDKKTERFWPPRRRVKSEPHQTLHGDTGPRARSCTSKTFGGLTHSFAARGASSPTARGTATPHFSANIYCCQTVADLSYILLSAELLLCVCLGFVFCFLV